MVDPSIADEIMDKRPHVIDHRQVDIKRAIPKGEDSEPAPSKKEPAPVARLHDPTAYPAYAIPSRGQ